MSESKSSAKRLKVDDYDDIVDFLHAYCARWTKQERDEMEQWEIGGIGCVLYDMLAKEYPEALIPIEEWEDMHGECIFQAVWDELD